MQTVRVILNFHDLTALAAAGLRVLQPAAIQCLPGAMPAVGDVVTHADLSYPSGQPAYFHVVSRAHEFGATAAHHVQLNLELLVLHQP
jgi:hypothetical protein